MLRNDSFSIILLLEMSELIILNLTLSHKSDSAIHAIVLVILKLYPQSQAYIWLVQDMQIFKMKFD